MSHPHRIHHRDQGLRRTSRLTAWTMVASTVLTGGFALAARSSTAGASDAAGDSADDPAIDGVVVPAESPEVETTMTVPATYNAPPTVPATYHAPATEAPTTAPATSPPATAAPVVTAAPRPATTQPAPAPRRSGGGATSGGS
ncbi:MAG: hypothetical protein R2705_02995 [Ilumatobacteraceae bacterium]